MRSIVKGIETEQLYILNYWENYIERMVDTIDDGREYIKYMVFHEFYYSVNDSHGRSMTPKPTIHYYEMTHNRLKPASGWWSRTLRTTVPTNNEDDSDRFRLCALAS